MNSQFSSSQVRTKIRIMFHSSVVIDCKYLRGIRASNPSSSSSASDAVDAMGRGLTTRLNSNINSVSRTRPRALLHLRHRVRDP